MMVKLGEVIKIAKILIVDDDADIVKLFEQFLKFKGHNIIAKAFNGEEALEIYRSFENTPNIIIMDHRMPVKNGLDTTKEILAINPDAKIIFSIADYTVREKALEVGAIAFLEKPIDFNTLFNVIEKLSITQSLNF
jgi:two-component system chemotaxis response regulator CheY